MHQPEVAITDFLLTIECFVLIALMLLSKASRTSRIGHWFMVMYAGLASASLMGGITHGFFPDESTFGFDACWSTTLISIGVLSVACANLIGLLSGAGAITARRLFNGTMFALVCYTLYVAMKPRPFVTAVVFYVPAVVGLLVVAIRLQQKHRHTGSLCGIVGITLTLLAAVAQQLKWSVDPVYMNYNVVYHLIQAVALIFIYKFAIWTCTLPTADNQA